MIQFRATNKSEAARKIPLVVTEILDQSKKFNSKKALPLLLCMEDAVNNLEIQICKNQEASTQTPPEIKLAIEYSIIEWYDIINQMIVHILDNGYFDPSTKIELPGIQFALFIGERCEQEEDLKRSLNELRAEKLIGQKAFIRGQPRLFLNKIPGSFCFILRDDVSKHVKQNFDRILHFRDLFYQKGLLETIVHGPEGTEVTFGANGLMDIAYPKDFEVESLLEKIGLSIRTMESHSTIRDWNSHFIDAVMETMKSIDAGKGETNLNNLEKEYREIWKAYSSMEKYPAAFEKMYGIDIDTFFGIMSALEFMCYAKDKETNSVGIWSLAELLSAKDLKRFGSDETGRVIDLLQDRAMSKRKREGLIILGDIAMTSFRRIFMAQLSLLDRCFDELYDNNLKGKAFENACRNMLEEKGLRTVPRRIDVFEPLLPLDVSVTLWGKQKMRTDIDVLANVKNNILVLECKEAKPRLPQLREQNQFKKYIVEHIHKVKWISLNLEKLKNYIGIETWRSLKVDEGRTMRFFPLLVSNIVVESNEFRDAPITTFLELKEIISKDWAIASAGATGILEIEARGRTAKLPWFAATIKN